MKVPSSVLPHRITLEPYAGNSATGPTFGIARTGVRARVQAQRRAVRTGQGSTVTSSVTVTVRPDDSVIVESRVTLDSDVASVLSGTYTVVGHDVGEGQHGPVYVDLLLVGPR